MDLGMVDGHGMVWYGMVWNNISGLAGGWLDV